MFKKKFIRCTSLVNPNAVTRTNIEGVEHIIVSSFTLPNNVVMNNILYPAAEIDASFEGLNRTLAPVEHPVNVNGQFVSANDPEAIHGFHAGAFNDNAEKVGNRVKVDKIINVQEALKSEKGRRLLDRINELETSESPRPIHTSTGIFLEVEELAEPQTNEEGHEFSMIARNMVFDHDAILLDSIGAAQPSQGVGMAVNNAGEKIDVETVNLDVKDRRANQEGQSFSELHQAVHDAFERSAITGCVWIEELFDDHVIFHAESGLFSVPFSSDDSGRVTITGIPLPVERKVTFIPKTNSKEANAMEKKIRAALNAVGIDTKDMDDDALLTAYNKLMTEKPAEPGKPAVNADPNKPAEPGKPAVNADPNKPAEPGKPADSDDTDAVTTAVNAAIKPLQEQVTALTDQLSANSDAEKADAIKVIVNSKKFPELDEDTLNVLPLDKLQNMAASCGAGHGLPFNVNTDAADASTAPADMPE